MKKKVFLIIKILVLLLIIATIVFLIHYAYTKIQRNRFQKMLEESDSHIYTLIEKSNDEEFTIKVRDYYLLSESEDEIIWIDADKKQRVLVMPQYKTAVVSENDENVVVHSLNYTYLEDFFKNSNQKFKYLGKEDGCFKVLFTEKQSKKETTIFINEKTKMVDKIIYNIGGVDSTTTFQTTVNNVSKADVAMPDIDGYHVTDSSTSNPSVTTETNPE